jgi:hypothetical protein
MKTFMMVFVVTLLLGAAFAGFRSQLSFPHLKVRVAKNPKTQEAA